jgi:hypothetical protein
MARVLICVYCGQEYPQGTPASGESGADRHIKICPKHPLRKAEEQIVLLREALLGLCGVEDDREILEELEARIPFMKERSEADRVLGVQAVQALLATMPEKQKGKQA